MHSDEVIDQLIALDEALFGERPKNVLSQFEAPFDISRPNIHDSKSEFLRELAVVESILGHCDGIIASIIAPKGDVSKEHEAMTLRLAVAINVSGLQDRSRASVSSASDLIMRNLIDAGLQHNFIKVVILARDSYYERLQELKRQEELFWSVSHRPPNYYARTIALRFAKHFGRQRREKPTFGTSSDSDHPSTDYGRALEEVFKILEIEADVRKAAVWAIDQLTDGDWKLPPKNALFRYYDLKAKKSPPKNARVGFKTIKNRTSLDEGRDS